jgi:hypothetical protein
MRCSRHVSAAFVLAALTGCVRLPYAKASDPLQPEAVVEVRVLRTSEGEHAFLVAQARSKVGDGADLAGPGGCKTRARLADAARADGATTLRFLVASPTCGPGAVAALLGDVRVVYAGDGQMVPMIKLVRGFTQFDLRQDLGSRTAAAYAVEVRFDPGAEVEVGGLKLRADAEGRVRFAGVRLDVGEAAQGRVRLVDAQGREVLAERAEDGRWYVTTRGVRMGSPVETRVEVEALR